MMPATSLKQKRLMDAVAHSPAFAKKTGIPTSVAKDFSESSKGMKFRSDGTTRAKEQSINRPKTNQGSKEFFKEGGQVMATKNNGITKAKMGSVKTAAPSRDGMAVKGKTKGKMVTMPGSKPLGMKHGGMTKKMNYGGKC
jgi:hypothetical protein